MERVVLMSNKDKLEIADFREQYQEVGQQKDALPAVGDVSLEEMEIKMIEKALAFHNKNISLAAKSLGITRSALYRRLQKYGIPYDD